MYCFFIRVLSALVFFRVFFFKQKTAYEMRISDWSSDVCSSDLTKGGNTAAAWRLVNLLRTFCNELEIIVPAKAMSAGTLMCLGADKIVMTKKIGRASCRERVCQSV